MCPRPHGQMTDGLCIQFEQVQIGAPLKNSSVLVLKFCILSYSIVSVTKLAQSTSHAF